jgi:hypothetical protein
MENLKNICPEEYVLTNKILQISDDTINLVKEFEKSEQNIFSSTAFAKINISFRAAIELCNKYFPFDAFSVIRSMFETLCILKCICEDSNFATEYKNSFLKKQEKLINKIISNREFFTSEINEFATEERKLELKKEIEKLNAKDISNVANLASKANLTHLYLTFYSIASDYVHGSVSNLSNYLTYEGENVVIDYKPTPADIKESLLNANYMALIAIETYSQYMKVNISMDLIDSLGNDIQILYEKVNAEKYSV